MLSTASVPRSDQEVSLRKSMICKMILPYTLCCCSYGNSYCDQHGIAAIGEPESKKIH
jgi:hypothetical protein